MNCTQQELKNEILLIAESLGKTLFFNAIINVTLPELVKILIYQMFLSEGDVFYKTSDKLIMEYCKELEEFGFVTFKN